MTEIAVPRASVIGMLMTRSDKPNRTHAQMGRFAAATLRSDILPRPRRVSLR